MNIVFLIVLGLSFHCMYLFSIIDIYFRSPLVSNVASVPVPPTSPARRLVLFVGDGLRADKLLQNHTRAPFLHAQMQDGGAWGVSHTRVPTESRPGHVAMIAGFYEDVSAVTKGWKHNPVEFDSVVNQSTAAWLFGSPDIVPMFAAPAHVHMQAYAAEMEDFGGDLQAVDVWTFDKAHELFDNATRDAALGDALRQRGVMIFLHLLGLDMFGHAKKPYSAGYLHQIEVVDRSVRRFVERVEEFYAHDDATAYVFTADHGMSDKGSHGDGERANTETPLVAWGAGVRRAQQARADAPPMPSSWHELDHLRRVDVNQADIAPLMAALLGVSFPVNSVGILPTDYLDMPAEQVRQLSTANLQAIYRQLRVKAEQKRATSLLFTPFRHALLRDVDEQSESAVFQQIADLVAQEQPQIVDKLSDELLRGMHYYQTYDWPMLMTIVTCGYTGWMAFVFVRLMSAYVLVARGRQRAPRVSSVFVLMVGVLLPCAFALLALQHSPLTYYGYVLFPILFWADAIGNYGDVFARCVSLVNSAVVMRVALFVALLEAMVLGYFRRELFGVGALAGAAVMFWQRADLRPLAALAIGSMALFPFLPSQMHGSTTLVCAGGVLLAACAYNVRRMSQTKAVRQSMKWSALCVLVAACLVAFSNATLDADTPLPWASIVCCWTVLFAASFYPLVRGNAQARNECELLAGVAAWLGAAFVLLSVNYEVLFFCSLSASVYAWLYACGGDSDGAAFVRLRWRDVVNALVYVFLCYIAFFGTGNVASISSFEVASTYRFVTVFSPFLMGGILIWKLTLPNIVVAVAFACVQRVTRVPAKAAFLCVMLLSELITLNFFFLVQDSGSWLDIGVSISHFALSNFQILIQLALFGIAQFALQRARTLAHPRNKQQ